MRYVGIDGDNIGNKLELCLLENNEIGVKLLSREVEGILLNFSQQLSALGMEIIFCSGDSLLCKGESINLSYLSKLVKIEKNSIKFSVGVGYTVKDAYIALKYAKASGKNKLVSLENDRYTVV